MRPTLLDSQRTIEVNIFDFDSEIYGEEITLSLVSKIRKEVKFENIEMLGKQLIKDKEMAIGLFRRCLG